MINSPVAKIKERLTIEEVVSTYIKLERVGSNLKARCPFHNEKTPSFFISTERGSYYCFGCGAKGDIFSFVEEFEGLDFKGALKLLAEKAGVPLGDFDQKSENEKEVLYKVMEEATVFFENNLKSKEDAIKYLKNRGLKEETIKHFRIGFIEADWRNLYNHLKSKKFKDEDIEKAGLVKKTEKGFYDRFRGRIIFPLADSSGRVIAFSGRLFVDDGKSAKYLNSPDTPIFNKSFVLYGLDKAKESIKKNNFSILVEGQMDLVMSHQSGWRNTIATSGTALSDMTFSKENVISNLGLAKRLSNNIVLAFDGDKAGINATKRAGKIALSLGMDTKVAKLPIDQDPADVILSDGGVSWKEIIKNSKHLIEFLLENILLDKKDDRKVGRIIKEELLPFVDALDSSIEKSFFLKKISDITSIPISALEDDLKQIEKVYKEEKQNIKNIEQNTESIFRKDYILKKILGIIFWQESKNNSVLDIVSIKSELSDILKIEINELTKSFEDKKEDLIFEAEVFYEDVNLLEKEIKELLLNLTEESLKEELSSKMQQLYKYELNNEADKSAEILKECQIISNKIESLKNSR